MTAASSIIPFGTEAKAKRPARGEWFRATLKDGRAEVWRFVERLRSKAAPEDVRWYVDRGAYGAERADRYVREDFIVAWVPAQRPRFLLSWRNPLFGRKCVGRFEGEEQARAYAAEHNFRNLMTDVRVEERAS